MYTGLSHDLKCLDTCVLSLLLNGTLQVINCFLIHYVIIHHLLLNRMVISMSQTMDCKLVYNTNRMLSSPPLLSKNGALIYRESNGSH